MKVYSFYRWCSFLALFLFFSLSPYLLWEDLLDEKLYPFANSLMKELGS
jgi:hypothetical protein